MSSSKNALLKQFESASLQQLLRYEERNVLRNTTGKEMLLAFLNLIRHAALSCGRLPPTSGQLTSVHSSVVLSRHERRYQREGVGVSRKGALCAVSSELKGDAELGDSSEKDHRSGRNGIIGTHLGRRSLRGIGTNVERV